MIHTLKPILSFFILLLPFAVYAQVEEEKDWHHKDPTTDGILGVGSERAYQLLKDRKSTKVMVAILDSGFDINHEDLKDNLWVNEDEIAGNGIDDDQNGYIDDVHGWNFLGNAEGVNLDQANLEVTRIYRTLAPRFRTVKSKKEIAKEDLEDYHLFLKTQNELVENLNETASELGQIEAFMNAYTTADSTAKSLFGINYSIDDILAWEPENGNDLLHQSVLSSLLQDASFSANELEAYYIHLQEKLQYYYNPQFVDRSFLGDDYTNTEERFYGNNDISAPHNDHGTHVAGIVGAVNDNAIGINGLCKNVALMLVRTVPNGDEFDKDVANAIRYAVDNGASIINMSFGKAYSPQVEAVHSAIRYAEEHNVLLVHGAGNDSQNLDKTANFPNPDYTFQNNPCSTWLSVGASSFAENENLVGVFSNYGKKKVSLFAPGVQVYSTKPDNTYEFEDGTSMAAPVVSGVAALIKSYFPALTAVELKDLLLASVTTLPKTKVFLPAANQNPRKRVKFKILSASGGIVNAYNAAKLALAQHP
ncbi:S8 family peptidase [Bacteroidota bacterium]